MLAQHLNIILLIAMISSENALMQRNFAKSGWVILTWMMTTSLTIAMPQWKIQPEKSTLTFNATQMMHQLRVLLKPFRAKLILIHNI